MNDNLKLDAQLRFALEIDRLKEVYRQTRLLNTNRRENSAEHSWHLAVLTMVLRDYIGTRDRQPPSPSHGVST